MANNGKDGAGSSGFEQKYNRLSEIVSGLEQGKLTLDDSIALYEEGAKLYKECRLLLEKAQLRAAKIAQNQASGEDRDDLEGGFEQRYDRLGEIVSKLEQEKLGLDDSLAMCEEGAKLSTQCRLLLEKAQLRITEIE